MNLSSTAPHSHIRCNAPAMVAPSHQIERKLVMTQNSGGIDKILRIVAGIALIALTVMGVLPVWGYVGIVPLATGLMGWCPLYTVLGINTCPMKKTD